MKKIIGIGNALVDVMTFIPDNSVLDKFGLPKGSMQLVDDKKSLLIKYNTSSFNRSMTSGGSAANTIHGIAMLGAETGFIGSVGRDENGDFFERDMKKAGVRTVLFRRSSVTGTAIALISPDTERTFATHLGAATELSPDELTPEIFRPYNILYLEGYLINDRSLVERACRLAKENNMEVALDMASYNVVDAKLKDFKEIIESYIDIVFANEEEARSLTGLKPEKALRKISDGSKITVVKLGKEGSLIRRGEDILRIDSLPVKSIDTTGAGDLYAAGFLYGYGNDVPLDICGRIGSIVAGHVIEIVGARMDETKWNEIKHQISAVIDK